MNRLQLHRVADPRTEADAFDAMDEASDYHAQHAQHAHELRRSRLDLATESLDYVSGDERRQQGAVWPYALGFGIAALLAVCLASYMAGVPVEDVLREIWAAGRVRR